jgi:hypothetical protein
MLSILEECTASVFRVTEFQVHFEEIRRKEMCHLHVLPENIKIQIYRTVILSVLLCGVTLVLKHLGKKMGFGCSRIGC